VPAQRARDPESRILNSAFVREDSSLRQCRSLWPEWTRKFSLRSFTKSIAVPVFSIARASEARSVIGVLARAVRRRRRCGVPASRALAPALFKFRRRYYASRLVRLDATSTTLPTPAPRDDGITPETVARGSSHEMLKCTTFT